MSHYLELAVRAPRSETENVHQLRVFSRRAAAAMDIFEAWLPPNRGRSMRKSIKRVRQAAGAARDFDVLLLRWTQRLEKAPSPQGSLLLEEIIRHRHEAQPPIEAVHEKLAERRFARKTSKLVDRIRERAGTGDCAERFGCMARVAMDRLLVPYLKAAQAELDDAEALHAFRIQGKQVRYAMEIFSGAFDEEFRGELYPAVVLLQERLGAINDHFTAKTYFCQWLAASESDAAREALECAMNEESQALDTTWHEFLAWWTSERRADLCGRFARYVQPPHLDESHQTDGKS
jgi:CHAD domain-containing protein